MNNIEVKEVKVKNFFSTERKNGATSEVVVFLFMSKYHLWSENLTIEKALVKYGGRKIQLVEENFHKSNQKKLRTFHVSGNQRLKWEKEHKNENY